MGGLVAGQSAGIAAAVVRDRSAVVLPHHVNVKIHQAFARNPRSYRTHAVRSMAHGTGEAILRHVVAVFRKTGVSLNFVQIMTLGAHAIRPVEAYVWIGKQVRDLSAGHGGLAELIVVLEDMRVDRTVRTVRADSTELAIVVAVVAIAAENPDTHQAPCRAILIQHVREQARLWQRAQTVVRDGMARGCGRTEFRNHVQAIRR